MKKVSCIILISLAVSTLFAMEMPFFSGYAGISGDITSDSSSSTLDPQMTTQAFFAGQFDINGNFFLRTELSLKTEDILNKGLFNYTTSQFRINELSMTYYAKSVASSHFFSLFLGNYESIGSDLFLQRQFGIKPITSNLTESWNGISGSSVYPFYGAGGSYVLHFEQPFALGIYAFACNNEDTDENVFNADIRFACAVRNFTLDFSAGFAFPHEQSISETGENVVLLIRTETLHAGMTMLIGNRYSTSLFVQAGFSNLDINPESSSKFKIASDDMYLFLEPRISTRKFDLNFSIFSIPQESVDEMIYLHDPLGANVCIFTDKLYIDNTTFTFGIHTTLSFPDKTFMDCVQDYANILTWDRNVYLTPFTSMPLFSGTLSGSVSVSCLDLTSNWMSAIKGCVGYKTQF
ncbi:MAG: hypothetical protein WCQ67_05520 [Treponema sp.]